MPRPTKRAEPQLGHRTLIADNGAYTIKAGFVAAELNVEDDCHVIPNCIARGPDGRRGHRIYVADQLDECKDFAEMAFRRPVEKGFVVNWESQMDIWKQIFFDDGAKLHCDPHETNLIFTEAPNCPQALQNNSDQMIFEEFEFASAYRCVGPVLNAYNDIPTLMGDTTGSPAPAEALIVIDCGHSHTIITPILHGQPIQRAIRRLEIGGKLLTNRLKEIISLRHFSLMDEPHLVGQIKEDVCYVSLDFAGDLSRAWSAGTGGGGTKLSPNGAAANASAQRLDYVLPDYHTTTRGHTRSHDPSRAASVARIIGGGGGGDQDAFPLGNERFTVPELLFAPTDLGMAQAGLPEAIVQSVSALPEGLWPVMLANVLAVGGTAAFPGFVERLQRELRAIVKSECVVRVRRPKNPLSYTWLGGAQLAQDRDLLKQVVTTREEYLEHGSAATARRAGR